MTRRKPKPKPEPTRYIEQYEGHSDEWIKWWNDYKYRFARKRPTKKQEAEEFILSMSGPAADRLAKRYVQFQFEL